jgi:hypothetical protein
MYIIFSKEKKKKLIQNGFHFDMYLIYAFQFTLAFLISVNHFNLSKRLTILIP